MKKYISILSFIVILLLNLTQKGFAQDSTVTSNRDQQQNTHFVDENGDGYNDNAPDHDGDGIPNGLDPDYQKLKAEQEKAKKKKKYVDLDGDGINDYEYEEDESGKVEMGKMIQQQNQGSSSGSMDQGNQGTKGSGGKEKGKKAGGKK